MIFQHMIMYNTSSFYNCSYTTSFSILNYVFYLFVIARILTKYVLLVKYLKICTSKYVLYNFFYCIQRVMKRPYFTFNRILYLHKNPRSSYYCIVRSTHLNMVGRAIIRYEPERR